MDSGSPANPPPSAAIRASAAVRRALGRIFQVFFHDELGDLGRQAERLGSASVESSAYLGLELQALNQRLSRIEAEVASLRDAVASEQPPS
jgi:hypothetical protein